MQYGYNGNISSSWRSQNEGAESLANAVATQILIWETVVGERDSDFNHVSTGSYDAVLDQIGDSHPLRAKIYNYYNSIVSNVQNHSKVPSFMKKTPGNTQTVELAWNGSEYTASLTDTNGVLGNFTFSGTGLTFSVNGNTLIISAETAPSDQVSITAEKKNSQRRGVIVWTDGHAGPGKGTLQDLATYAESVTDPVKGFLKAKVSLGSVKIVKESEDGIVDGISFRVQGNGVDQTVKTANGGQIQIDNLRPGTYTVTEVVPDRYEPQAAKTVTVTSGQTATVSFSNSLKRGDLKIVKTAEDGVIAGIPFTVTGNGVNKNVTTDSKGEILIEGLLPGTYTVTENHKDYYEPNESRTVTVVYNEVATVTFNNTLKRGDLTVTKTAEDGLTEGMTFQLTGTSDAGYKVNEYATVGKDGKAYFTDVLIGKNYVLKEVNTPIRYVIPEAQTADILWNEITEKSFENILKKWRVDLFKLDSDLAGYGGEDSGLVPLSLVSDSYVEELGEPYGQTQGDATLEGAVYGVYKDGVLLDTYTTDKNGYFITDYYPCYDNVEWTIREISPSEGYLLDPTVYYVDTYAGNYTVELNTEYLDVTEDIIKGKISLIKHTDDGSTKIETPEEGAMFEVFLKSAGTYENARETERDLLRCDEFGFAETVDLPYGVYVVKQIKGWEGRELLPAFEVNVSENGEVYRYLINNRGFESYLHVVKTDATTGKTIPYAGAGFQIYSPDGKLVTMTYTYPELTVIDTFYTTEDGTLLTPEKLPYGKGYSLVEVQAPHGYVLDSTPIYFDVTAENSASEDGITIVKVVKENEPQKGTITVIKTGEVFSSVIKTEGGYQPVYEVKGLAGAVYEITAAEDIITPDGTVRYTKGQVVATVTTDENGKATSEPLFLGRFTVREVTAPYGMTLNGETVTVELTYAGQDIAITATETSFVNERQKVKIDLSKVMEQDENFGIGNNGEILSVVFGIYAAEDITAADGSSVPKDGLIEAVTCDENGGAVFTTDLPVGAKLYVKELQTDSHYILSDKAYPVNFEYAGQTVAVVEITVNDGDAIGNEIIRGNILGKKSDEDGNIIVGALFGLFRENETDFTEETAIQTAESGEDGIFTFEGVPYGRWIVREIKAAPAFVLNENSYAVTVGTDGETIEITIENEFITGSVTTTKVDKEYPDNKLTGAVFEIYLDADGDGKFNAEADTLVGEMTETESGVYAMNDLRYGGYFLYEKTAPEGFLKDEGYHYFEIQSDGETVTVENEAGVGFVNQPITGELELTKTDIADGKPLAKVGFRIRNEAGEVVAEGYTDENGIAKFTLRYGKYTYEEFAPLDGYIPDEKAYPFEIREDGEIVKAAITNERIPTPDIPQTGDNSNIGFWIGLAAVALGGLVATAIVIIKQKKDDDE